MTKQTLNQKSINANNAYHNAMDECYSYSKIGAKYVNVCHSYIKKKA